MRKLILIATITTMASSSCYAGLSLASNESTAAIAEEPRAQAVESRESRPAPVAVAAKPRKKHLLGHAHPTYPIRVFYRHCL